MCKQTAVLMAQAHIQICPLHVSCCPDGNSDIELLCLFSSQSILFQPRSYTSMPRWSYVALACKDVLIHNGVDPSAFKIIPGRAPDVQLSKQQLPVPCNLLIANGLLDDGV